mgnify:CR=1 FL=1
MSLNPKQLAFAHEYVKDWNATQAAKRAGYSEKTAYSQGFDLLKNPEIQAYIGKIINSAANRAEISVARVLEELALIGMSDLRHYTIDDDGHVSLADGAPESAIRAVSSLKRKVRTRTDRDGNTEREVDAEIRLWDKPRGLDMIGKYLAMFVERTEGNLSVRIVREEDGEPASE